MRRRREHLLGYETKYSIPQYLVEVVWNIILPENKKNCNEVHLILFE